MDKEFLVGDKVVQRGLKYEVVDCQSTMVMIKCCQTGQTQWTNKANLTKV